MADQPLPMTEFKKLAAEWEEQMPVVLNAATAVVRGILRTCAHELRELITKMEES